MALVSLTAYCGKRVCVALSGGVDSVCLLHCFLSEAQSLGIALSALTCEHGIRGEQSLRDLEFVRSLCNKWGVTLFEYTADIPARAAASGRGLEEEGRLFRYECFQRVIDGGEVDFVATAHHQDDLAETVLFRLARGTSLCGLNAIRERNGIVRPFLGVSRIEIERYAKEHGLAFVTDESNFDERYSRNAIRRRVLPALEEVVNGAGRHVAEFARRAAEDDALLQSLARERVREEGGEYFIPVALPFPLFSRACLFALKELGCNRDYSGANLEDISSLKNLQSGRSVNLPAGVIAVREGKEIAIRRAQPRFAAETPFRTGRTPFGKYLTEADENAAEGCLRADFDTFPKDCVLRTRREGDVFRPFGGGEKPLKKYLTDRKIPAGKGWELPLVAKGNRVYAVFGVEISDEVKVTDRTERVIYLKLSANAEEK